jgi:hypothetical protein
MEEIQLRTQILLNSGGVYFLYLFIFIEYSLVLFSFFILVYNIFAIQKKKRNMSYFVLVSLAIGRKLYMLQTTNTQLIHSEIVVPYISFKDII